MERRQREGSTRASELLQATAAAMALPAVASLWEDLVSSLGRALGVDWAFVGESLLGKNNVIQTLAAWHRGKIVPNFEYTFERSAEDDVLSQDVCLYTCEVQKHLSNPWLQQENAQAFGRVSLPGPLGGVRGLLAIAHSQPLEDADMIEAVLRIFGFRAGMELERWRADEHFYRKLLEIAQESPPSYTKFIRSSTA
ncbi:MAG: hypothetical protein JOY54_04010 [Acidobacteriaceae bacterium]|nr:hypothetical protein [Acidobacteriaceae bacterium]